MFFNRSKDKKRSRREQANEKLKEQSRQKIDELYPSVEAFNKAAEWKDCDEAENCYAEVRETQRIRGLIDLPWTINIVTDQEYRCKLVKKKCNRICGLVDNCSNCNIPLMEKQCAVKVME